MIWKTSGPNALKSPSKAAPRIDVRAVLQLTRAAARALMDFVFPPRCLLCGTFLCEHAQSQICDACLRTIERLGEPRCERCGRAFASPHGDDRLCGACMSAPPYFDRARSAAAYAGVMRQAIHELKFRHRTVLARPLARLMAETGADVCDIAGYDLLVPVPLHSRRLRQRGFNQALLLARHLGGLYGVPVAANGLRRIKWTAPQTSLPALERRRNVRAAFAYRGDSLRGKRVLVIDDVYTSGSTVNECARALKKSGAPAVDVLTLARAQHVGHV